MTAMRSRGCSRIAGSRLRRICLAIEPVELALDACTSVASVPHCAALAWLAAAPGLSHRVSQAGCSMAFEMPSTLHEALVLLFRESPRLAPMLLARTLGKDGDVWLPEDADIQVTSSEFADLDPPEYRADVVLRIPDDSDTNDRDRATREVVIVEVQLDPDPLKHFTWPQYVTAARTRFRCPATLVVVAVDERVARWCGQPITLDRARNVFRPVVIGPASIPVVTDEAEARTWPELAVLSVIAHGHEPGSEVIGATALAACDRLDSAQARLYADLIYANLNEIARAALEALMQQHNYTYQSDFAKKYVAEGIEEGKKEGRKEGRKEGLKEGLKEGRKEGIELGYRAVLRAQLEQRFGELPADALARLEEADADTLDVWARRVLTAGSLADVFAPEPR
jgi:hypothetical protein